MLNVGILLGRIGGGFEFGMMMGWREGVGRIRIRICGCGGLIGGFVRLECQWLSHVKTKKGGG